MPYLDLPGVNLWYEDTGGRATPVVFLHAVSGTADSWVYQLPVFTNAEYRCVTYDRRGWGRSRPTPTGDQPGRGSDDLRGLVDHLTLDQFHIVATAAGGIVGLDYALEYPEHVHSLVVANSIGGIQDADYLEVQHRLRPAEIQALPIELRELGPSYRGINPEGTQRWVEIERSSRQAGAHGVAQPTRRPITYERMASMQVPVLAIAGGADLLSPPALMRLLAEHIPQCQFAMVPEAGHAAFWEQPEVWNSMVLEFIGWSDTPKG